MAVKIASGSELKRERIFINPKDGSHTTIQEYLGKNRKPTLRDFKKAKEGEGGEGEAEEHE